jgi:hypothetical protein
MKRTFLFCISSCTLEIVFCVILVITGCKRDTTDCFTNTGKIVRQVRNLPEFDSIDMENYVNLILRQDSVEKVEVETGENLQDGIETTVVNRQLLVRNNIICNWLRSYSKPINVYVSVINLKKIYYNSSGNITTENPIRSNDLRVEVWGGSGTIDMDLNINGFGYFYIQMGTADFRLRGNCSVCNIFGGDYGLIQAEGLVTGYCYATNHGTNDIYVNALQLMSADIESIGNIYYSGKPDSLIIKIHGAGQVIHL